MDNGGDRRDEQVAVERVHLRPRQAGNGLALPPLVPMVAVVFAFAGLAVGFRLGATAPAASPTTSAVAARPTPAAERPTAAAAELTASAQVVEAGSGVWYVYDPASSIPGLAEIPPTGGLTLKQVLAILDSGKIPTTSPPAPSISSEVIYSRVVRLRQADPFSDPGAPNPWVWAVAITGPNLAIGGPSDATVAVETSAEPSSETIVLDYRTGELIETFWTSIP